MGWAALPPILLLASAAAAQSAPPSWNTPYDSGGALRDAKPPPAPKPVAPAQAPEVLPPKEEPTKATPPRPADGAATLFVRAFEVLGAAYVPAEAIKKVLAPYKGRALTLAQIEEAAGKLTTLYREHGYVVARVYVPKQDARSGTLKLQVVIGKYGKVTLKNDSLVSDGMLNALLAPLREDAAVRLSDLEQSMLRISDLPGAELPRLTISAGAEPGSSDFLVEVPRTPIGRIALVGDNMGSPNVGEYRLNGSAELYSPLGFGDKLSLNLLGASDGGASSSGSNDRGPGLLTNVRAAYNVPLALRGLRAELAVGQSTYALGGPYHDIGARGRARQFEGSFTLPLLRTRKRNFYLSVSGAYRSFRDETNVFAREVRIRKAGLGSLSPRFEEWTSLGGLPLYLSAGVAVTVGHVNWVQNQPRRMKTSPAEEPSTEEDVPEGSSEEPAMEEPTSPPPAEEAPELVPAAPGGLYSHISASLFVQLELAPTWLFSVTARGQHLLKTDGGLGLDPSEQFLVSGPFGVRSYRSTITGDNGYVVSGQLSYLIWVPPGLESKWNHSLGVFADLGGYGLENEAMQMCTRTLDGKTETWTPTVHRLQDVGAGYSARFRALFGSVQFASGLGTRHCFAQNESRGRLLVQLGVSL